MKGTNRTQNSHGGFTIVELLIVIVVIAILAAIIIVAYNGITGRARDTSLKSDLQGAASQLEASKVIDGSYPASSNDAALKTSPGNALTYVTKPYGYCVSASNPADANVFSIRSSTGSLQNGSCDVVVSTLAGSGTYGTSDGTGTSAQFSGIYGSPALDAAGNIYVADSAGNCIRKITPAGVVTTLAGTCGGSAGTADGTGAAAQFNWPTGLAVDSSGMIYVADTSNSCIRKITTAALVSTFAGTCGNSTGAADGTGSAAKFNNPQGVAVDTQGDVYVTDSGNTCIRKISPSSAVTTFAARCGIVFFGAADGTGSAAQFNYPLGIAVDTQGNVYVADDQNDNIRKITSSGVVTTLAGSGQGGYADGAGAAAEFSNPDGVTADAYGNVYVADRSNQRIRMISFDGTVSTVAGSSSGYADGIGTASKFKRPYGLAIDPVGTLYVADTNNYRIRKISL
jgi:prepilin-type N-terminal cleavage/methylation domain-containing protein